VPAPDVERKDYMEYLSKLDGINYKKDEVIKQYIDEIKSH
jgi:hypothetical protein